MDGSNFGRISVTPTVARQTPKNEFGHVLSKTLNGVVATGTAIFGNMPGMPIISSAVSSVTALANTHTSSAASAAINITPGAGVPTGSGSPIGSVGSTVGGGTAHQNLGATASPDGMGDMLRTMKEEANRSMAMQMFMQTESREYNTLTNILKLRHDSAKAAINNIR